VGRVRRGVDTGDKVEVTSLSVGDRVAIDPIGIADGALIEIAK